MERPFPIEDLVDRIGNRYAIVVGVAKRARQLKSGAKPLIEIESKNPTTIALHEIAAGLVKVQEPQPGESAVVAPEPKTPDLLSAGRSELDPEELLEHHLDEAPAEIETEAEAESDAEAEVEIEDEADAVAEADLDVEVEVDEDTVDDAAGPEDDDGDQAADKQVEEEI